MQYFSCRCLQKGIENNVTYKKYLKGINYSGTMLTEPLNLFFKYFRNGKESKRSVVAFGAKHYQEYSGILFSVTTLTQ